MERQPPEQDRLCRESPEYQQVVDRFLAAYGAAPAGPYRDDAFIADAIMVFCIEVLRDWDEGENDTRGAKAARAIAQRLMALPPDRGHWLVTFPYVFLSKDNRLTDADKEHRAIAFDVFSLVEQGTLVTHAFAQVAAQRHVSPQKVSGAWYGWQEHVARINELASRRSGRPPLLDLEEVKRFLNLPPRK
jgi:hypothetical protein